MIELTVKTLDSQNHQFSVEDDITVEQFKVHIADKVNIPATSQRIIYCGRVLQDGAKLADYDVNGKVVHLVQRAPPNANSRNPNPRQDPAGQESTSRRGGGFMGFDRVGNAVYMGSMSYPNNFMDSHESIPPWATHSLSASRLNIARRMLRNAENVIRLLENPTRGSEQTSSEEPAEEEMTPIIEARLIVPGSSDQPIDENAVFNAVENSIFNVASGVVNLDTTSGSTASASNQGTSSTQNSQGDSSTSNTSTPRSSSAENLNTESTNTSSRSSRVRSTTAPEMAELINQLNQLQARFAPFLSRYQNFMRDDPEVSTEDEQSTHQLLNRISQVLHYLGHAYHSLSDIMINVEHPPPRSLLCRPILIQQSAVVQTGIPIQVEAQINLSTDPPTTSAATSASNTSTSSASAENTNSNSSTTTSAATTAANVTQASAPNMGFVSLPFMPSGSMRVITTPVEIRAVRANARPQPPNNNNNNATPETAAAQQPASNQGAAAGQNGQSQQQQQAQPQQGGQQQAPPFGNNPNVEFFMEVTPEVFRNAMNGPPPEFFQSLMQLVNTQLLNRVNPQQQPQPPSQTQSAASTAEATSGQRSQNLAPGQNSQARGNTQTHPTTATHTRSTARPHIHMTQQTVQGGFDPFLPCYSHHVTPSRTGRLRTHQSNVNRQENSREQSASRASNSEQPRSRHGPENIPGGGVRPDLLGVVIEGILRQSQSVDDAAGRAAEDVVRLFTAARASAPQADQSRPPRGAPDGEGPTMPPPNAFATLLGNLIGGNTPNVLAGNLTLDQLFQLFQQDDTYIQGDSIVIDLVMLLVRNLRLTDLLVINSGNMAPLNRNRALLQEFFVRDVCQGDTSPEGVERATERILRDLRPLIDSFTSMPTRDNINLIASIERLVRHHIPIVINTAVSLNTDDVSVLLNQLWATAKRLLFMILNCASNGQQGLETVFEEIMASNMRDIPADLQSWTIAQSRGALRAVMVNLDITMADIEQFIVHNNQTADPQTDREPGQPNLDHSSSRTLESMEVDYDDVSLNSDLNGTENQQIPTEDSEPLPTILWGSESWHRQTPEDWVPIITRDVQKQRRQNPQAPFSDAYLSGMPSKRRKIIKSSKPQGSLPQIINDSVRQAIMTTGLTAAAPLDTVATAAGTSTEIQSAYRTLLRTTVQANLRDNEDFTPDRFPNASNYFNGYLPE